MLRTFRTRYPRLVGVLVALGSGIILINLLLYFSLKTLHTRLTAFEQQLLDIEENQRWASKLAKSRDEIDFIVNMEQIQRINTALENRAEIIHTYAHSIGFWLLASFLGDDTVDRSDEQLNNKWLLCLSQLTRLARLRYEPAHLSTLKNGTFSSLCISYRARLLQQQLLFIKAGRKFDEAQPFWFQLSIGILMLPLLVPLTIRYRQIVKEKQDSQVGGRHRPTPAPSRNYTTIKLKNQIILAIENGKVIENIFDIDGMIGLSIEDFLALKLDEYRCDLVKQFIQCLQKQENFHSIASDLNPIRFLKVQNRFGNDEFLECQIRKATKSSDEHNIELFFKALSVNSSSVVLRVSNAPHNFELYLSLLESDESIVEEFLTDAKQELRRAIEDIDDIAKRPEKAEEMLDDLCRIAHQLKGDAGMLKFKDMVYILHQLEDKFEALKFRRQFTPAHFQRFKAALKVVLSQVDGITAILAVVKGKQKVSKDDASTKLLNYLQAHLNDIAASYRKQVQLINDGFHVEDLPSNRKKEALSMLVQLLRNAVIHGIEEKKQRAAVGKAPTGSIFLKMKKEGSQLMITVRDDGAGIDTVKLIKVALRSGRFSRQELERMSQQALCELILQPGFSTAAKLDEHAGRGIGMDVVNAIIKRWGGKLHIKSKKNQYTEFLLLIPC